MSALTVTPRRTHSSEMWQLHQASRPLRFPLCPSCPLLKCGSPEACLRCAVGSFEAPDLRICPVCSQSVEGDACRNALCGDPGRHIRRIRAIGNSWGGLRRQIIQYKYDVGWDWAPIFGRLLLAWMEANCSEDPPDLIVANPTYVPANPTFEAAAKRRSGHTERVIAAGEMEDVGGSWHFDVGKPAAIVKTAVTPRSAAHTAGSKRLSARRLERVLAIPDPTRIQGRSVLVYDDICTTGRQLDAIARHLVEVGGATSVEGVVLARAPWRPRQ